MNKLKQIFIVLLLPIFLLSPVNALGEDWDLTIDYEEIENRIYEAEDDQEYYLMAEEILTNGSVYTDDYLSFFKYFTNSYQLYLPNSSFSFRYNSGYISSAVTEETIANRINTINWVLYTCGIEYVTDEVQAVKNAAARVNAIMAYDSSYSKADTITAITSGRGVCAHYARAALIILNAEGIPTRLIYGTYNGSAHAWNECYINGSWVIIDFTNNPNGFVSFPWLYVES